MREIERIVANVWEDASCKAEGDMPHHSPEYYVAEIRKAIAKEVEEMELLSDEEIREAWVRREAEMQKALGCPLLIAYGHVKVKEEDRAIAKAQRDDIAKRLKEGNDG